MSAIETTGVELTQRVLKAYECEESVRRAGQAMLDAAVGLRSLKDEKLYLDLGYPTWEAYCTARLGWTPQHANRVIEAAGIMESLRLRSEPIGSVLPTHESQVRPLRAVDPAERAEVWAEAVESADGGQPTAKQVEAVIAARRIEDNADTGATGEVGGWQFDDPEVTAEVDEFYHHLEDVGALDDHVSPDAIEAQLPARPAERTPIAVPKPTVAPGVPPHPATYPDAVMAIFRELIPGGSRVLDPFAGVGTIHELRPECVTSGIEIEAEWAATSEHTLHGDSRTVMAGIPADSFDVVATSPAYGNRLADPYYEASDAHARRSYALDLGRPLSDGSGAGCEFDTDGTYEELHEAIWAEAARVVRPGGLFLLNCKDFQRDGRIMPVTGWHIATLTDLGFVVIDLRTLPAAGLPFTSAKPLSELVVVLRKERS